VSGVPRSQRLIGKVAAAGDTAGEFTSPAGYVTLVKSALFWNATGGPVEVVLYALYAGASSIIRIYDTTLQANATGAWNGWFVLNPGDEVAIALGAAGVVGWVSGAVLAGPNQFPSG
jgi:hypothetical protein